MNETKNLIQVINDDGRRFNVRLVVQGESYGRDNCLAHDKADPLVEFYDATYANQKTFGALGQFVSRYYLSTLKGEDGFTIRRPGPSRGLCLDGGVEVWHVSGANVEEVLRTF
jgi:hypothetical protein